jgi:type I restriction enzyme M protein
VGVVIEEDGKTEEEFLADLATARDQLQELSDAAGILQRTIWGNFATLLGEELSA